MIRTILIAWFIGLSWSVSGYADDGGALDGMDETSAEDAAPAQQKAEILDRQASQAEKTSILGLEPTGEVPRTAAMPAPVQPANTDGAMRQRVAYLEGRVSNLERSLRFMEDKIRNIDRSVSDLRRRS